MRTLLILTLPLFFCGIEATGQSNSPAQPPTELLSLVEGDRAYEIDLQVTVDGHPYDEYWAKTVDVIFAFADGNSDGALDDIEVRLVPSARAVRLSLGTGFTPPVAPIQSLKDVMTGESSACSKEDLLNYYRRHGAGRLAFAYGKLPNTAAMTQAIVEALDEDRDGKLSQGELQKAETILRPLDANDDDLIGVGELVPGGTYPGNWATNSLAPTAEIDLSKSGDSSFVLKRIQSTEKVGVGSRNTRIQAARDRASGSNDRASWQITVSDQVRDLPLKLATKARCDSWSVQGPLSGLYDEFRESLSNVDAAPAGDADTATRPRDQRPARAWLTPLVDRDHNNEASQAEIDQWLALQRRLIDGHLMISLYYGGGLFELLDTNHDAGLSVRELRTAWQNLESASCISEDLVDVRLVPNVLLLVASRGYPSSLARKTSASEAEWFRQMDRNADGDVSRREFTGSPDAFRRLDRDRDGLISTHEADDSRK